MFASPRPWPLLLLVWLGALYGAVTWFAWQAALAASILIVGLTSMAWLGGTTTPYAHRWSRVLSTVWMVALFAAAALLLIVSSATSHTVPSVLVLLLFVLAPAPWAAMGLRAMANASRATRAGDHQPRVPLG